MIEYGNDEDFEFDDIYGENYDHLEPMEDWEAEMEREHEDMHKGVDIDEIGTLKVPPENDFEDLLADMDDVKDPFDDLDALDVVDNPDLWGNPDIDYRAPEDPFADMDALNANNGEWGVDGDTSLELPDEDVSPLAGKDVYMGDAEEIVAPPLVGKDVDLGDAECVVADPET